MLPTTAMAALPTTTLVPRPAAPRRRLTMTQLLTLLQCGWKYQRLYVERARRSVFDEEPSPARAKGIATHALLQAAFERHLGRASFPDEHTLDALLSSRLRRQVFPTEDEWQAARREVLDQVCREVAAFDPAERTCLGVELTCSFPAPEALFTARVDRLDLLASGGLEIVEYKGGRGPQAHGVQSALLHMLVAWTYQDRPEYRPIRVTLVHLPTGMRDRIMFCHEDLVQARLHIVRALHRLDAGEVVPQPGPYCAWCPFATPEFCPAFVQPQSWEELDSVV